MDNQKNSGSRVILEEPTREQLEDACMWYRHDFGLLSKEERDHQMSMMRELWLAIFKACKKQV